VLKSIHTVIIALDLRPIEYDELLELTTSYDIVLEFSPVIALDIVF
jgi:hypothetical protein